jgi:hypothetical protein
MTDAKARKPVARDHAFLQKAMPPKAEEASLRKIHLGADFAC